MFGLRAYRCPACSIDNGVDAAAVRVNEEAGVETWGPCWSCGGDFQLTTRSRVDVPVARMLTGYRSPIESNIAFSMWHPLRRSSA